MDELENKKYYARFIHTHGGDRLKAALQIYNGDVSLAMQLVTAWGDCQEVLDELVRLDKHDYDELPSKSKTMRYAWEQATNKSVSPKDRLRYLELYSNLGGYLANQEEPQTKVSHVMIVKEFDNWEDSAIKQQKRLIKEGES